MMDLVAAIYFLILCLIATYSAHPLLLTMHFLVGQRWWKSAPPAEPPLTEYPYITIQLPVFNEALVIERLIRAVAGMVYPRDRVQIQVLDDSNDDTTTIAASLTEELRGQGVDIEVIRRPDRRGFKAGALGYGLASAKGDFIAVFDADFVPQADFLLRTVPHLLNDPEVGFVQARWGHLNRNYSWLTRAIALIIDSHFQVDQQVRYRVGYFMNFNGTAGIWRRVAIERSGGWEGDTLCEDLDLSFRTRLNGWKPIFLAHLIVPAELTPQLAAYKQQQFRWAKGSIQCWRKLGTRVAFSRLSARRRIVGLLQLSGYLSSPLILSQVLLMPLMDWAGSSLNTFAPILRVLDPIIILSMPLWCCAGMWEEFGRRGWFTRVAALPSAMLLGSGLVLNNSVAVYQGLTTMGGQRFGRTPKFNIVQATDVWEGSRYRLPVHPLVIGELLLAIYCFVWFLTMTGRGVWGLAVPCLYFTFAFGITASLGLWEARSQWRAWFHRSRKSGALR